MYDTASGPDVIPKNAKAVAGYVDGEFQTFRKLVAAFYPHAHCVSLSVHGASAEFFDYERGNFLMDGKLNPLDVARWVRSMINQGFYRPGVYVQKSNLHAIRVALTSIGLKRGEYRIFMANWIGRPPSLQELKDQDVDCWQYLGFPDDRPDQSVYADDFFPKPAKKKVVVKLPQKPKPKVTAATVSALVLAAITTAVHSLGLKIDPAEAAGISAAAALIGGYFYPEKAK